MLPEDIIQKEFSRSFFGYDMQEVDTFLDGVIDQMERMEGERKEMIAAMEYLLGKLEKQEDLPAIKAKYLKGAFSPEKQTASQSKTPQGKSPARLESFAVGRQEKKPERKSDQNMENTGTQGKQKTAGEEAKLPPRKVLRSIEKMQQKLAAEPVAIEMETMESAPLPGDRPYPKEDAV